MIIAAPIGAVRGHRMSAAAPSSSTPIRRRNHAGYPQPANARAHPLESENFAKPCAPNTNTSISVINQTAVQPAIESTFLRSATRVLRGGMRQDSRDRARRQHPTDETDHGTAEPDYNPPRMAASFGR